MPEKNIYFCFIGYAKLLTVWITTNYGKFLKRWEYQILPASCCSVTWSWETCIQVKKQQLELDMEQLTGSKLVKEYDKTVYCHPVYLISMQTWSVTQSRPTLCDPMDCKCQASLSITNSLSLLKLMSTESVMSSNHLILCLHLRLPPSIYSSLRVFSNDSVLCIRWPKYCNFRSRNSLSYE